MQNKMVSGNGRMAVDPKAREAAAVAQTTAKSAVKGVEQLGAQIVDLRQENRIDHEATRATMIHGFERVNDRMDASDRWQRGRIMKISGALLLLLCSVTGYLLAFGTPWQ